MKDHLVFEKWMKELYEGAEFYSNGIDHWTTMSGENPNDPLIIFEWDPAKNVKNMKPPPFKGGHEMPLIAAAACFFDEYAYRVEKEKYPSYSSFDKLWEIDKKEQIVGDSEANEYLYVAYVKRGNKIRLISTRKADAREIAMYINARNESLGIPISPQGKKYSRWGK